MNGKSLSIGVLALTMTVGSVALISVTNNTAAVAAPQVARAGKTSPAILHGIWKADPAQSDVSFSVAHLGISRTRGWFDKFAMTANVNGSNLEKSSVEIIIDAASINTRNAKRDEHLRSKDFFDVATYPAIIFKSTAVKNLNNGDFLVNGNCTAHGVTRPITARFRPAPPIKGPDGKFRSGLSIKMNIDRRNYGLTWNGLVEGTQVVGNMVEISVDVEAIKQ
jgi:polyisoprenoid-binding protein YceI